MANAGNNKGSGNNKGTGGGQDRPHTKGPQTKSGSKPVNENEVREKIAIAVFLIIMLLLFLCNFGLIGTVGDAVSGFLFGVFGFLAYITPPGIVALFFIFKKFRRNKSIVIKTMSAVGFYFWFAIIFDMISKTGIGMESYSFATLYTEGAKGKCGGGLVAGTLSFLIHKGLGYAGLVIILLLTFFLLLVALTEGRIIALIQKFIGGFVEDQEIRAARREEKRQREEEKREQQEKENLLEGRNNRRLTAKDSNDEGLLRNKQQLPVPGFNENAATESQTTALAVIDNEPEQTEVVQRENKLTIKEKMELARAQKAQEKKEKQKAREEEREVKSILKIVPPSDEQAVPTRYVKQDMHEVFITDENVVEPEYTGAYREPYSQSVISSNELDYDRSGIVESGYGYPKKSEMVAGSNSAINNSTTNTSKINTSTNNNVEYNGLEGRIEQNPLQKVKIKKQGIRSEHIVTTNEEFLPFDENNEYSDNYDLTQFEEETVKPIEIEPAPIENVINYDVEEYVDEHEPVNEHEPFEEEVEAGALNNKPKEEAKLKFNPADSVSSTAQHEEKADEASKPEKSSISESNKNVNRKYVFPPLSLLKPGSGSMKSDKNQLKETAIKLEKTLRDFGVNVTVEDYVQGPSVTRFEMTLEPGTKVSKILSLSDDIKLSLASADVRIEAPIPGKSAVGIEVPNKDNSAVALRTLFEDNSYKTAKSTLSFAVGMNIGGEVIISDIAKMPHVLIAGATGSGKSVCINTLIMSILYKSTPDEVQMIMIDPKVVELSVYNGIPHLLLPVVTDPKKAAAALAWGVKEMEERYKKFADLNVRDLSGYNEKVMSMASMDGEENKDNQHFKLPKIIIIIDELADLMMTCGKEVEAAICRLAQLARACGIHLVVATQRPSVDVITGLIKANMPSRVAFKVSQGVDSRTILDTVGAEKLLGKGDMLFYPQGKSKPERVQGAFVSDDEVSNVVSFLKEQKLYNMFASKSNINLESADENDNGSDGSGKGSGSGSAAEGNSKDELYAEAGRCVINSGKGSIGFLQRKFQIGFNRAARIMDDLAEDGVVGSEAGTKAREILMTIEEFESFLEDNGI